jgi:hypothetical protein
MRFMVSFSSQNICPALTAAAGQKATANLAREKRVLQLRFSAAFTRSGVIGS